MYSIANTFTDLCNLCQVWESTQPMSSAEKRFQTANHNFFQEAVQKHPNQSCSLFSYVLRYSIINAFSLIVPVCCPQIVGPLVVRKNNKNGHRGSWTSSAVGNRLPSEQRTWAENVLRVPWYGLVKIQCVYKHFCQLIVRACESRRLFRLLLRGGWNKILKRFLLSQSS